MGYKVGDVVMKCKPFVHSLNASQKAQRCDHCFKINDNLRKCSKCKSMYYCDQKCQRSDWSDGHRHECHLYDTFYDNCLTRDCDRFLLRLHLMLENNDQNRTQTHEFNGQKRCFDDLMTHYEDILQDSQRIQYFDGVCDRFHACLLAFDRQSLLELFCKICINSFSILNEDLNHIGSGIYINGSALNHSCVPNAATIFSGIDLEVRALKPIAANEEVFINYLDLKMSGTDRRLRLREQYYFDCNCLKCDTNSDVDIDYPLVKSLDQEFDELITNQNDWLKCHSIGVQSLPLYQQIYGDFHPDLTVQLLRVLKVKLIISEDLNNKNMIEMMKTIRDSIAITHGFEHKLFDIFKDAISL